MHRATPATPRLGLMLAPAGQPLEPAALAQTLDWQGRHAAVVLITDRPGQGAAAVTVTLRALLAAGIDPKRSTIALRSSLPALADLARLCLDFVTVARLERHRPAAEALRARGFERDIPAGLLAAPVQDAAAVIGFRATELAGRDASDPLFEQTNELIRHLNTALGRDLLPGLRAQAQTLARSPAPQAPHQGELRDILREGTLAAREITQETRDELASALGLFQL